MTPRIKHLSQSLIFSTFFALMLVLCSTKAQSTSKPSFNPSNPLDFGMNKPHLLFHIGTRDPISVNYGFGYWSNNAKSSNRKYFSPFRLWYENTQNGLYVDMKCHDGESIAHELITDKKFGIQSDVKYQLIKNKEDQDIWEESITIQKNNSIMQPPPNATNSTANTTYWYTYMTVQNNDPSRVDLEDYSSPIRFQVVEHNAKMVLVDVEWDFGRKEQVKIVSQQKINIFGFSMNVSESYEIRNLLSEVQHLIELERYRNISRKDDKKLVEWENEQVKLMRKKEWMGKKYVVLCFYGEFEQSNQIYMTNSSNSNFDLSGFQSKQRYLVRQKYFPASEYPQHSQFLQHMIFNLYGGLSFYYGKLYTQNSLLSHQLDYSFTFTPSRLIFPRAFLWDDGFHMSVAVHHHPNLVFQVLNNWFKKIDLFGWIGRQQIRGYQMSSLMPEVKFIYQDIFEMNPPTILMPLISLIEMSEDGRLSSNQSEAFDALLSENYWKLQKWYRYFVKTQSHNNLMYHEAINKTIKYRWRCKDQCERGNFMGSGLDDYPRIQKAGEISKQHIDIISWIYFFSESLEQIAQHLGGKHKSEKYYSMKKHELRVKIIQECLDEKDLIFKDLSVKSNVEFVDQHVTKLGYMNLFPFLTGMLRESEYEDQYKAKVNLSFNKLLQIMSDESILFSEDGLRSLSLSDSEYGTLDNYWRGPVWMPINYMVLRACKKYYWQKQGVQAFYQKLRTKLIATVHKNYQETGYLYENYYQGKGNRGHPFYGWTTLLVNIISEKY